MALGGKLSIACAGAYPLYTGEIVVRLTCTLPAGCEGLRARAFLGCQVGRRLPVCVFPFSDGPAADGLLSASRRMVISVRISEDAPSFHLLAQPLPGGLLSTCHRTVRVEEWRPLMETWLRERTHAQDDADHDAWMRAHRCDEAELARQRAACASWDDAPLISIVTPVFKTPEPFLREYLDSVLSQTYPHFELVLVNASGPCEPVDRVLAGCDDPRVRVVAIENAGIAANTNVGIAEARGAYVGFSDHDDLLEPDALFRYVEELRAHPACDLLFCDEDLWGEVDGRPRYYGVRFKPGWDPDLLYTHNYVCHLLMVSRRALELTQRSGDEVNAAQDYDLTLRVAEVAREIRHVPRVLYHWREHPGSTAVNRDSKPYALEAGRLAVQAHLARIGVRAQVAEGAFPFSYRVRYELPEPRPTVSVIVDATRVEPAGGRGAGVTGDATGASSADRGPCVWADVASEDSDSCAGRPVGAPTDVGGAGLADVARLFASLATLDGTPELEVVLACRLGTSETLLETARAAVAPGSFGTIRAVEADLPFRPVSRRADRADGPSPLPAGPAAYSARALDAAVRASAGAYVLLLDAACEIVAPDMLVELLGPLQRTDVGCTGPLLLDPDDVVQADGLIARSDATFGHAERLLTRRDFGYMTMLLHARGCCALPTAGLMLRRRDYDDLGGLDEGCGALAAPDLCLRLSEGRGLRCVVQPYAPLRLWAGRLPDVDAATDADRAALLARHPSLAERGDPCLNPHLDPRSDLFQLEKE